METKDNESEIESEIGLQIETKAPNLNGDEEETDEIEVERKPSVQDDTIAKQGSETLCLELPNGFKLTLSSAFIRVDFLVGLSLSTYDEFVKRENESKKPKENGGLGNHFG